MSQPDQPRRTLPEAQRDLIRRQAILRHTRQRAAQGLPAITIDQRQQKRKWNADYQERLKLGLVKTGKRGRPRKEVTVRPRKNERVEEGAPYEKNPPELYRHG